MVVARHKKEALKRSKKVCSNSFVMKHEKSLDKKLLLFPITYSSEESREMKKHRRLE